MSFPLAEYTEVGVELVRVRVLSSSSCKECSDLKEPKRLLGRPAFCKLLGRALGISRSMLALELILLIGVVGLDGPSTSLPPSVVGEPERGLEENKGAMRRFFCSIVGALPEGSGSSMGVKGDRGGRKMLRLFRRRLSDIFEHARARAQAASGFGTVFVISRSRWKGTVEREGGNCMDLDSYIVNSHYAQEMKLSKKML